MVTNPIEVLDISTGDLIKIFIFLSVWIGTFVRMDMRLRNLESDIKQVVDLAKWRERLEERVLILRRDIDELRHGKGYIMPENKHKHG